MIAIFVTSWMEDKPKSHLTNHVSHELLNTLPCYRVKSCITPHSPNCKWALGYWVAYQHPTCGFHFPIKKGQTLKYERYTFYAPYLNWCHCKCSSHDLRSETHAHCFSVAKSCLTLCDPMDGSMAGFPVLHHLPEFAQTHVHWGGDAIQPLHPLWPPSPLALSLGAHTHNKHPQHAHTLPRCWRHSQNTLMPESLPARSLPDPQFFPCGSSLCKINLHKTVSHRSWKSYLSQTCAYDV